MTKRKIPINSKFLFSTLCKIRYEIFILYVSQNQDKKYFCEEAQIMLEVVKSIEKGTKSANSGKITMYADK